ncbi:MAG: Ftsk gamma domain [Planctomycetota bacterium]
MTVNLPSQDDRDASSRTVAERLLPLLPIGGAMFTLSALVYYHLRHSALDVRSPLQLLVAWTYRTFGFAPAFLGCLLLLTWGSIWFAAGRCTRVGSRLLRLAATVVMLGVFLNLGEGGVNSAFHKGELGVWLAGGLVGALGYYPSVLVVWATTVGALLLATDFFFRDEFERMRAQPEAVPERGVESEVTEVLKGLGAEVAAPESARPNLSGSTVAVPAAVGAPSADVTRELSVGRYDDQVEFEPELEPTPSQRVRPSYYERRYAAIDTETEWAPAEPESQEIDNAESAELEAFAAEPAVIDESVEVAEDELFVVTEEPVDAGELGDPVLAEAEAAAEFEEVAELEAIAEPASASDAEVATDAESPTSAGLAQRGLFDEPPPAPRASIGEWLNDYEESAVASGQVEPAGAAAADVGALDEADELDESDEADETDEGDDVDAEVGGLVEIEATDAETEADEWVDEDDSAADAEDSEAAEAESIDAEVEDPVDTAPVAVAPIEPPAPPSQPMRDEVAVPIPRPANSPTPAAGRYPAALIEDATALVVDSGRASAALLQRKLRIDFDTALGLLAELSRLGVVELSADAVHGRVLR